MQNEFAFLVNETISNFNQQLEENFYSGLNDGPGIFYTVNQSLGTFVIRAVVSENLEFDYSEEDVVKRVMAKLKIEDRSELRFFECEDVFFAKKIKEVMANKRFSTREEDVLNISDPGDSWWGHEEDNSFTIYMGLSQTHSIDKLTKLGPLGDKKDTLSIFHKLEGFFDLLFPITEYSSGEACLKISTEKNNDVFSEFKKILFQGEVSSNFLAEIRALESARDFSHLSHSINKATYYLIHLGTLRRFWIEVQGELTNSDYKH